MAVKKGQALNLLWSRMKGTRGAVSRAATIANVTERWIRVIVRDQSYQNEQIVKACIQALNEIESEAASKIKQEQDYHSRMEALIIKELNNEPTAPPARSEQTDKVRRHSAATS